MYIVEKGAHDPEPFKQVKVQWKHFGPNEYTWEMVDQMRALYPSLFAG